MCFLNCFTGIQQIHLPIVVMKNVFQIPTGLAENFSYFPVTTIN